MAKTIKTLEGAPPSQWEGLDTFMGAHMMDIRIGAWTLVNDYYNRKGNPFKKLMGEADSDWYMRLRAGEQIGLGPDDQG